MFLDCIFPAVSRGFLVASIGMVGFAFDAFTRRMYRKKASKSMAKIDERKR